mmetsp:Transcript_11562/g.28075  ORF Transcript_11562/g.28075 Transcript_11562/m.28075 type:complete len:335 (-) Transcript_11562:1287-2291(-)
MVPTVSAANSGPRRVPRMYATSPISSAVGTTLNTMELRMNWIPRVPRSMVRVTAPVCRLRWKDRSSRCRCSNTRSATPRIAPCATLANVALRSSLQRVAPVRAIPYPTSIAAGVSATAAPRGSAASAAGPVAVPAALTASPSMACLNRKGVPTLSSLDATRSDTAPTTRSRCSGLSLGQMYGMTLWMIFRSKSRSGSCSGFAALAAAAPCPAPSPDGDFPRAASPALDSFGDAPPSAALEGDDEKTRPRPKACGQPSWRYPCACPEVLPRTPPPPLPPENLPAPRLPRLSTAEGGRCVPLGSCPGPPPTSSSAGPPSPRSPWNPPPFPPRSADP